MRSIVVDKDGNDNLAKLVDLVAGLGVKGVAVRGLDVYAKTNAGYIPITASEIARRLQTTESEALITVYSVVKKAYAELKLPPPKPMAIMIAVTPDIDTFGVTIGE